LLVRPQSRTRTSAAQLRMFHNHVYFGNEARPWVFAVQMDH
jgi:hypothetical protein